MTQSKIDRTIVREQPIEKYRLTSEPFYLNVRDETAIFETAYQAKLPVMLKGPTGCGKTRFVQAMAWRLGRPLITVACHEDLSATDLVGRFLLEGDVATIGRQAGSSIHIPDSNVSRLHAELRRVSGSWTIEDRGSTNGTRINGTMTVDPTPLAEGDLIALGAVELRVERG